MDNPSRLSTLFERFSAALVRRCEIDLRALAAFRIALGAMLLVDLGYRTPSLRAFYTDSGVLPLEALSSDYSNVYSIHTLSGDLWYQALLFIVAAVFAIALLVGYRTRLATAVSWLLLLSLRARNPMIGNAGDHLLGLLLFWGIFLPLGARWAVDTRRTESSVDGPTVVSMATLGVLLQVILVYATNGVHKFRSEEWMDGEAVVLVFQADQYTVFLGDYLASQHWLLEFLTVMWVVMLFLSPLLLVLTGFRRAMLATLFLGAHAGMALTIGIATFPFVSMTALLVYYPPCVWDGLTTLVSRTSLQERVQPIRQQLRVPSLPSPSTPSVSAVGADHIGLVRNQLDRAWKVFSIAVPYLLLVLMITSAVGDVGYVTVPQEADRVLETTETDQHWGMFAPDPVRTTRWYAAPGQLENGSKIDVLHESEVDMDKPADADETFRSARWRKYFKNVQFADNENHRSYLANHLCERWNREHDTSVETVSVWTMWEYENPYNGTVMKEGEFRLIAYDCSGPLVQE